MRRTLYLAGAALIAGVVMAVAAPSVTKATTAPAWFETHVSLSVQGHNVGFSAFAVNRGSMTHTGDVTVTLVKLQQEGKVSTIVDASPGKLTLRPGQTWLSGSYLFGYLPSGTYRATITANHVFQFADPLPLLGAVSS